MTARQTLMIIVIVLVAIVLGRIVQHSSGWLWGALVFFLVVVAGGLIARYISKRDLDPGPNHES